MRPKTVFDHISKHLEVGQKYSAARRIFNSVLGVWKCDETLSVVFDISLEIVLVPHSKTLTTKCAKALP